MARFDVIRAVGTPVGNAAPSGPQTKMGSRVSPSCHARGAFAKSMHLTVIVGALQARIASLPSHIDDVAESISRQLNDILNEQWSIMIYMEGQLSGAPDGWVMWKGEQTVQIAGFRMLSGVSVGGEAARICCDCSALDDRAKLLGEVRRRARAQLDGMWHVAVLESVRGNWGAFAFGDTFRLGNYEILVVRRTAAVRTFGTEGQQVRAGGRKCSVSASAAGLRSLTE